MLTGTWLRKFWDSIATQPSGSCSPKLKCLTLEP